jgi:hypothetical protein
VCCPAQTDASVIRHDRSFNSIYSVAVDAHDHIYAADRTCGANSPD